MNSIILHISDLHISLDKKIGGEVNNHDSYLDTSSNEEPSFFFIDKFISTIKKDFLDYQIYLLITGDITDRAEIKEFEFALKFIDKIISELNIVKKNVLLIPGDHDLNRRSIENLLELNENSTLKEVNNAKFENFKNFYYKLLKKEFDPNKIIFDNLLIENSINLLGINSCTKLNLTNRLGNIPIQQFEEELRSIPISGKQKHIACFHHNLTSAYENKNDGQWDKENRQSLLDKLLTNGVEYVFTGNEHSNSCKSLFLGNITTSDSGCLSSKKYDSTFKIYNILISDDVILTNKIYSLQKTNGNDSVYEWDIRTNKTFKQPEEFIIFKKTPPPPSEVTEILSEEPKLDDADQKEFKNEPEKIESKIYYNKEFTDILYDKVKELNLFQSGHFHWSETSRAHNWIDTSKLIENKDNLSFIKNAVIDVIEKKKFANKIDLIIGLGYEGNIISSKAAIKFNKPYAFLPYSYRHDEHHKYENELNFNNESNHYKNILIITDVVNDGRTIRKLIRKRQNDFFKNVDKVYVVSLFYTGESILNNNILNYDFINTIPNYDIEKDEEVNNIEFYTVKSLKVEKCPYGDDFRETCLIVKDGLGCINLFYDESKYIK
ncbi:metallophosphoesterase [Dokdonia sp. Asnod3-C12]|uniref:metallophosphoesterase n=1 Tax=Dokdonia sp. Asnod3-C12 TaxID=3160575 RepID=UPI0038639C7C